ncbi:sigma-70 family RNA polymerase sigma factor [Parasporobacterium paucivorans]|uniref:Sigma-70, region 4 n=1 Tax=Parasporobacterium paucivorans DSM 15970 TaxID=1122934 RepID=A0A1M6F2S3_9FIRM|nr:sigma-70 family RNA polymerase sigma factor [Parasporobacterium paucivorans]SHI92034.1 Sigma-70, region 4 [Parasporobacterium paucivorans DSM 15970]
MERVATNEELVAEIQQGINVRDNMETLYRQNEKLLYKICSRFQGYSEMDDLMQEAFLGIHSAVDKYDAGSGCLFMTYAIWWIRQALFSYLENCNDVKIPRYLNSSIQKYNKVTAAYLREYNRKPIDAEYKGHLDINQAQLDNIKDTAMRIQIAYLDAPLQVEGDDMCLCDTLSDHFSLEDNVIDTLFNEELKADLMAIIDTACTDTEKEILILRYFSDISLKAAGESVGMTTGQARGEESRALNKIRKDKSTRKLKEKYQEIMASAWRGGNTWTSSTERTAFMLFELERKQMGE